MAFSEAANYSLLQDTLENLYQRSYSHGLEKIYALENVNILSIRKISSSPTSIKTTSAKKTASDLFLKTHEQLELPFESLFQKKLPSFIYREPIHVLDLSKRLEQQLLMQDKRLLGDLLDAQQQEIMPLKGIGQGHFDEISTKLQCYLDENTSEENKPVIQFVSWLKSLLGGLDAKKCAILLETYQLPLLLPISPSESAEMRKMTPEKRLNLLEEAVNEIQIPQIKELFLSDFQQIVNNGIKPWMRLRGGIATSNELFERLSALSDFYPYLQQCMMFFGAVFFKGCSPLTPFLIPLEENLYCDLEETAKLYTKILKIAHSYFYNDELHYTLETLIQWVSRELASEWIDFSESFVERTLRLSSEFRVRRNAAEQLIIKLS